VGDQAFTILPLLTVDPASYFVDQRTVYFGKGVPTSVLYEDKHDIFYDIDSGTPSPSPNTWNRYTFDGSTWNLQSNDGVANAVANVYDDPSSTIIDVHTTGLVTDVIYVIEASGTSVNWTSIGASSDTVGTIFQKNAVAISGSGGEARRATKRLFWGPDEPDATNIDNDLNPILRTSDMWYNTETDTVSYRYDDIISAWVPYTAANSADSNKNYTYKSSTEPTDVEAIALGFTGLKDGDTWIDDANGKKQYRYDFDTTTWVRETPPLADLDFVEGNDTNRSSISIGAGALGSYTDQAMGNTTIGFESAAVLVGTTGIDNGDFNTSIGYRSLKNLTSGNFNTAVGAKAGINLIGTAPGASAPIAEGVQNCVFGYAAGDSFREASFNISIGSISGTRVLSATWADETSHHNIYIGRQAGADSFGDHNIFVGDSVGYIFGSDVTGSNNIIIGRNTNINAFGATDDNKFIINGRVNEQYPLILGDMSASPNRDFTINAPLTVSNAHGNSNGSLTVEGISTFAGNITAQSNATVEGFLTQKVGTDVLSAAALDLDASGNAGNYFDVTGTTTITSINTVAVGTIVYLHFDGACTLTHHATNLILPSGDDITTAAGDEFTFVEYGTGTWRCIGYTLASGEAIVGGAGGGGGGATAVNGTAQVKVLIDEITDPGSGGYVFDSLGSGYEQIIIEGQVKSTRASQDWDGLAMFFNDDETDSNYHKQSVGAQDGGNTIVIEGDDANVVVIPAANSNSDLTGDFEIVIEQPFGTTFRKTARSYYGGHRDAGYSRLEGRVLSHDTLTSAITKIKLISGEGGTVSGTIRMYGVKQATVYSNLNLTSVKSAAYTAEPFDLIPVNTNSGSVTITLPASPVNGQSVGIFDYHQSFGTNSCTLNRNGSNIEGAASNFVASTNNQALRFTWIDSGQGWCRTP
jgi:hypothetical protein